MPQEKASCPYDRLKFTAIEVVERKGETPVDVVSVEKGEEDDGPPAGGEQTVVLERMEVEEWIRAEERIWQHIENQMQILRDVLTQQLVEEHQRRQRDAHSTYSSENE